MVKKIRFSQYYELPHQKSGALWVDIGLPLCLDLCSEEVQHCFPSDGVGWVGGGAEGGTPFQLPRVIEGGVGINNFQPRPPPNITYLNGNGVH